MSLNMEEGPLKEAAIFTRAVENVFRKLIRLLLGRMTLTKLQEMIRIVYIEEAELKLKRERPGKNVALTKLGLLTGLDTRTLNRILEEREKAAPISKDESFLKGFSPGFRVLDTWLNDNNYRDPKTGKPIEIDLNGDQGSFEDLFARSISTRGVTSQSVLQRLIENNMITFDKKKGKLRLNQEGVVFVGDDELDMIDIGFWSAANLISTVANNVATKERENRFFQRSCWTYKLNRDDKERFRQHMLDFLSESHKKAKNEILPFEALSGSPEQLTAGVSMFYFEDEPNF